MKVCILCKETKNITDFYRYVRTNKKGKECIYHSSRCKVCFNKYNSNRKEYLKNYYLKAKHDLTFKEKRNEIYRKHYHKKKKYNMNYKIRHTLRARIRDVCFDKKGTTMDLVGCSIQFLRDHLESLFKKGMTWDNHGNKGWHIDHIRPCASFDLTDPEQQKECFHYSNLQPLWWWENLEKGDKVK